MPKFETEHDRQAEEAAVREYCEVFGYDFFKLPLDYRLDFALTRKGGKKIQAYVEVKCRSAYYGQFPTLMLSAAKIAHGVMLARTNRVPFVVLVAFTNGIYHWNHAADSKFVAEWGGRTGTPRHSDDIEPVIHIPITEFTPLKGAK